MMANCMRLCLGGAPPPIAPPPTEPAPGGRGGRTVRGGRGGRGGRGTGSASAAAFIAQLVSSVEAQSGGATFDAKQKCLLHHRRGVGPKTEDWALCYRSPADLVFTLRTLYRWSLSEGPTDALEQYVNVFTSAVDENWTPQFYKLPARAALALRSDGSGDFEFGAHPCVGEDNQPRVPSSAAVMIALTVTPAQFNFTSR